MDFKHVIYLFILSLSFIFVSTKEVIERNDYVGTELTKEEKSLYISTLDGSFIAVNIDTGQIQWQFKHEAAVKVPLDTKHSIMPLFLPDPKDGSLYAFNNEGQPGLKKLQFTIQQLVSSSPCRSADGIFYTGKKTDTWFMVDWRTGEIDELKPGSLDNTCSVNDKESMFLGRTEYNLLMYDGKQKERQWNITFYNYASTVMSPDAIQSHEYMYFSGSSTGKFAAIERKNSGSLLWENNFESPVIGVYLREKDDLVSLPFTTIDDSSINVLSHSPEWFQYYSTLYIGEHVHGLYALPTISKSSPPVLLLGTSDESSDDDISKEITSSSLVLLGYHKMPELIATRLQITGRSDLVLGSELNNSMTGNRKSWFKGSNSKTDAELHNMSKKYEKVKFVLMTTFEYMSVQESTLMKFLVSLLFLSVLLMFFYIRVQMKELKSSSNRGSSNGTSMGSSIPGTVTANAEEMPDGSIRVGKIILHTNQLLGKGCEGTFVFRGEFDNRPVAVKRLLPECFMIADREVGLLRESDQHPNVVRYFSTEQDKQFRYIALELCAATLQEYTEKGVLNENIRPVEILQQATAGLEHLHSLRIVHRDIKPHNVLLSLSDNRGHVRAMISDFGLCKKLQHGRASFSRRSGVTGTDGWIAPEMINATQNMTTAVDVFSLGCVFYYVLTNGKHPFGDVLRRQANIISGDIKLNELSGNHLELWKHAITQMVNSDPLTRPAIHVIRKHPAFWDKSTVLTFLQDVSDRIEKEDTTSEVLRALETGNSNVLQCDWRNLIDSEIADDLRKYRNYRGDSIRDLLRALRNKKHHYREMSDRIRDILGTIPDGFIEYWITRFPFLTLHTWLSMQCIKNEEIFLKYYPDSYTFPLSDNKIIPNWILHPTTNRKSKKSDSFALFNMFDRKFALFPKENDINGNWRQREEPVIEIENSPTIIAVDEVLSKADVEEKEFKTVKTRHRTRHKTKKIIINTQMKE